MAELAALADRTFQAPLDAVLAEVRKALPGCESWHARVLEASRSYEREAEPPLARAGTAKGRVYRVTG